MGDTDLKGIETKDNYDLNALESTVDRIFSGSSILFLGAGFSIGSKNKNDEEPPLAGSLSEQICDLGEFEPDNDLAYSADNFLRYNDPQVLIGFLEEKFNISKVENHHVILSSLPWRRIYTTNYDNCFEVAATASARVITPLSLLDSPRKYFKNSDVCVHINGAIQQLDESTLEGSFKLTESSYTNSDAFKDSSWAYRFRKDLENCTQIVFVGYSIADMEIRRLLFDAVYLKEKTKFITQTNPSTKSHHRLSRYGEVFPVGVEAFAELVEQRRPNEPDVKVDYFAAIEKLSLKRDSEYGDVDIRDFLLRGKADFDYHASALTSPGSVYSIRRHQIQPAISMLGKRPVVLIHSTVANGKTVLAQQIASQLVIESREVYVLIDEEGDYEGDAERLAKKSGGTVYLVIDSCEKSIDAVRYFFETLGDRCRFILTERPHRFRRVLGLLESWGIEAHILNADYLQEQEIQQLSSVLTHAGLWEEREKLSEDRKIRYRQLIVSRNYLLSCLTLWNPSTLRKHLLTPFQACSNTLIQRRQSTLSAYFKKCTGGLSTRA